MFTNKTNLIVFIVIIVVAALICSSVIAFMSIEDAKKENEVANLKIEGLSSSLEVLQSALDSTNNEVLEHEERIKKYQEIISAWSKATPNVNKAVKRITDAYEDVVTRAHLFPKQNLEGLEDKMMDAVYGAIRSTQPEKLAEDFEKTVGELNKLRYDNVIKSKITQIKQNGVTFPEDTKTVEELREYYNSFLENPAIIESFKEIGLDVEIANLEALIDADEESDLAKLFEKAVKEIQTPITLKTSLENANTAWSTLYEVLEPNDVLSESTRNARTLLDTYTARINQLQDAKEKADAINSKISALEIVANVATKNAISSLESQISAWIKQFEIDKSNMSLINDITPTKEAYEKAVLELRALYETFKKAVENIGKVNVNSKLAIDGAFKAYEAIKNYKDTNILLSLESTNTVEALLDKLQGALNSYNYLIALVDSIREEIDRLHTSDPEVSHDDISSLNIKVDELLSLEASVDVLNTEKTNYVTLLKEARLLPYKNEAFGVVKSAYDTYYEKTNNNRDIILSLVDTKDFSLNAIENAQSIDEINALVQKAKTDFENCFK